MIFGILTCARRFQAHSLSERLVQRPMPVIRSVSIFLSIAVLSVSAAGVVRAQENVPALTFDSASLRTEKTGFMQEERPTFNYENPYLNDTLVLQYQNILLEKMLQRQSAIARTERAFIEVGVPFDQPAPPRGICEQLPANVPCYRAYPDLYPGAVPDVAQIESPAPLPDAAFGSPAVSGKSASAQQKTPAAEPTPDFSGWRWAEVTCAAGQCSAVLIHNNTRRTVRAGDALDDGVRVESITATGVSLSKKGTVEELQAALAPSRGGAGSPKYGAQGQSRTTPALSGSLGERSAQLEDLFSGNTARGSETQGASGQKPSGASATVKQTTTPAAVNDPGPPLGPTGLF
jgi:hypothetical protein